MTIIAGVDGCKGGWIALWKTVKSSEIDSLCVTHLEDLIHEIQDLSILAIDIPIGLLDRGRRNCDVASKRLLGGVRGTSVFWAPIRPLLDAGSYSEANALSRALCNGGMSRQSHGIQSKVRAVDVLLQHHHRLREQIFEVHPEVSFYYWNDHTPILAPKRKRDGKAIRQALIADQFGEGAFARARIRHSRKHVKDDDLADAFAALWTAERLLQRTSVSIPPDPRLDATGLPMRIVA